ncbi:MAG: ferritin-like domain-containing protein [Ignisphaera sp.]
MEGYLDLFREMARREKEYSEALQNLGNRIAHPTLRAIFIAIANDSLKHSKLYEAIVELLSNPQPILSETELEAIFKEIERHIETEVRMIEVAKKALQESDDARVKLVLSAILSDEVEHHKVLVDIRDNLAKKEAVTEEDIWDLIWRNSPWHGTPGG